jgi:hypothetical protein
MAPVPGLVEAGVTDLRAAVVLPPDYAPARDLLGRLVESFHATTGRT